jgi:mxaJ protein
MSSDSKRRTGLVATLVTAAAIMGAVAGVVNRPTLSTPFATPRPAAPLTPLTAAIPPPPPLHDPRDLWVCADPNNMPFSSAREQGFENRIAELVAADLGRHLRYFWEPQRRGFVRTTLKAGNCDVIIGVPSALELVEPTRSYYQSTYVFVSRHDRRLGLRSFDDPRLANLRIGIQIVGEDYGNPPPAQALASRHLAGNVRGFTVYGDYSRAEPQRAVIDAVTAGRVDTAVVWGPLAGYFASRARAKLDITAVTPSVDHFGLPFAFEISMGVRPGAIAFRAQLDDLIERRRSDIRSILQRYQVPMVPMVPMVKEAGRTAS